MLYSCGCGIHYVSGKGKIDWASGPVPEDYPETWAWGVCFRCCAPLSERPREEEKP